MKKAAYVASVVILSLSDVPRMSYIVNKCRNRRIKTRKYSLKDSQNTILYIIYSIIRSENKIFK